MKKKTKILLVQLGSPKSPKVSDVRSFLKEFLGDPRVVDINPLAWKLILNLFVLPFRPARSAKLYSRIWDGESFPLITLTEELSASLNQHLATTSVEVEHAFLLSNPRISEVWDKWEQQASDERADKWLIVPLFPQYSESTTASVMDQFFAELEKRVQIPSFEFITSFHNSRVFIDFSAKQIETCLASLKEQGQKLDLLVISFHGIPKRRVIFKKDPYFEQCFETFQLIKERTTSLKPEQICMTFQSRFGSEEWLTPYTDEFVFHEIEKGNSKIAVYCPSFVSDCLETVDEIGHELAKEAKNKGGEIFHIPCLNNQEDWTKDFSSFLESQSHDSIEDKTKNFYPIDKEIKMNIPKQKMDSPPLTDSAKKTLKIVFLILFLDLVSFSIIFPLFPALADHYLTHDSNDFFLKAIYGLATSWSEAGGETGGHFHLVLFGGILGAIYSLLQFIAAPIWGALSDRIGRRPILLISVAGLAISYLFWIFAGTFTVLILARFIGGIMGGNISTATAVVADITQRENRSKGMAIIGIAFAFGFIIGPALGGILSLIKLNEIFPALVAYGVNPFSAPALFAFLLSSFNVIWLFRKFEETLPPEKRGETTSMRSANPIQIFRPLPFQGVNLTNFGHFLFLMAFSGMEFTITFLTFQRLQYEPLQNGYMFIFIGFIIALVQGGFVRRKASKIGEKKVALMGLISLLPGLMIIGLAQSSLVLYAGLFFLAVGSAMTIPCLTALVSLYTPPEQQGKSIGIFRSLGALARVIGPIIASLVYWKLGSDKLYFFGTFFLIIPILMVAALPKPSEE